MKLPLLIFMMMFSTPAHAQSEQGVGQNISEELANTKTLDAVTVVATRTEQSSFDVPAMTSVISFDDPSVKGASSVQDIFKNTPAVQFGGSARRNGQNPTLRGFDDESIIVLFDGVRQNFESQHDGSFFIDPSLLKKVEVVRGPSSALYGSGGLGGVIAFETKDAIDMLKPGETIGASTSIGYESVNKEISTTLNGFMVSDDDAWDALISVTHRNSGDIELGDDTKLPSDDSVYSALTKLNYFMDDSNSFEASLQYHNNNAIEPNNPELNQTGDGIVDKISQSTTVKISHEYDDYENHLFKLKSQIYYTNTEVEEEIIDPPILSTRNQPGDVLSRKLDTWGINLDASSNLFIGDDTESVFSYGVEYYQDKQNGSDSRNGERGGVPDAEAEYMGAYLQNEISFLHDNVGEFKIIPAIRFDKYESSSAAGFSNDDNALSSKLALSYKPKDWVMFFGSYAEAFRAPNLTEIYTTGVHFNIGSITNNFVPNPNLRPEQSENFEFGIGFDFESVFEKGDSFQFKIARFFTNGTDFIDQQVDTINNITTSVNVPNARLSGTEIEAAYEYKRFAINWGFTSITGKDEDTSKYLGSITPNTLVQNISLKIPEVDSQISWRATMVDEHLQVQDQVDERDGYVVHDFFWQYDPSKAENLSLNFGVENIFDKAYERVFAGSIEPGRNFKIQGSYNW